MLTTETKVSFIDIVKDAIRQEQITPEEGAAEIAFRLNAGTPESLKMGWPLVTSVERAIEVLGLNPSDPSIFANVLKRFRYDDERETDAVMVIGLDREVKNYIPWPDGPRIAVEMPAQGLIYGAVGWPSIGSVHPGRAAQFAKALRLAAHEIDLAGS